MKLTIPLGAGTLLSNVRYKWVVKGVLQPAASTGVTQPDSGIPIFVLDIIPPAGADEVIFYDNSDPLNWNVGGYKEAQLSDDVNGLASNLATMQR